MSPEIVFAMGKNGRIYLLTSKGLPDYQDAIAEMSIPKTHLIVKELIIGSGFTESDLIKTESNSTPRMEKDFREINR